MSPHNGLYTAITPFRAGNQSASYSWCQPISRVIPSLLLRGQIEGTTSLWCFPFCYHGFGNYCTVDDDTGQELVHNITPLRGSVCTIPPQPLNALQKDIRRVITGMGKNVGELVKLRTFLPPHVVFNPQQQLVYVNPKTNPQGLISAGKDPYEINYGNLTLYCIDDNTLPNKTRWFGYFKMSQHPEIYTSLYFVNGWRLCFPNEVKTHLFLDNWPIPLEDVPDIANDKFRKRNCWRRQNRRC